MTVTLTMGGPRQQVREEEDVSDTVNGLRPAGTGLCPPPPGHTFFSMDTVVLHVRIHVEP